MLLMFLCGSSFSHAVIQKSIARVSSDYHSMDCGWVVQTWTLQHLSSRTQINSNFGICRRCTPIALQGVGQVSGGQLCPGGKATRARIIWCGHGQICLDTWFCCASLSVKHCCSCIHPPQWCWFAHQTTHRSRPIGIAVVFVGTSGYPCQPENDGANMVSYKLWVRGAAAAAVVLWLNVEGCFKTCSRSIGQIFDCLQPWITIHIVQQQLQVLKQFLRSLWHACTISKGDMSQNFIMEQCLRPHLRNLIIILIYRRSN